MNSLPFKHKVLLSPQQIQERIYKLGAQISEDFASSESLVVIVVMKGAFIFAADLLRALTIETQVEFIGVSSYAGTKSTGHVRITHDLAKEIKGRDVLLIEDIIDSGTTIDYLFRTLVIREPKSMRICSFLSKPHAHKTNIKIDYVGFEISNEFVIGYGLDLDERYRHLPELIQVLA